MSPSTDGGAGIPDRVAKDIAAFVRDARITGRTFLRLTDVDLNKYALQSLPFKISANGRVMIFSAWL